MASADALAKEIDALMKEGDVFSRFRVEEHAKNPAHPDSLREYAGMKLVEHYARVGRNDFLLYYVGNPKLPGKVRFASAEELAKKGKYAELLARGERYPEEVRVLAGTRFVERLKREKDVDALTHIVERSGHHPDVRVLASNALVSMENILRRAEVMARLKEMREQGPQRRIKRAPPRREVQRAARS